MSDIVILGAGGHGAVVLEIAQCAGFTVAGFADDDPQLAGASVLGYPVLGGRDILRAGAQVALAVGGNAARARLLRQSHENGWHLPVLLHPRATISRSALIAEGTVVMANAVINARAEVGPACIVNTACSIDHDCVVGGLAHIAPGSRLGGNVAIGDGSLIGIGASLLPRIEVGCWCVVGAGSVVTSNVPDAATVIGCPARIRSMNAVEF